MEVGWGQGEGVEGGMVPPHLQHGKGYEKGAKPGCLGNGEGPGGGRVSGVECGITAFHGRIRGRERGMLGREGRKGSCKMPTGSIDLCIAYEI
jgi:hypothetical protein